MLGENAKGGRGNWSITVPRIGFYLFVFILFFSSIMDTATAKATAAQATAGSINDPAFAALGRGVEVSDGAVVPTPEGAP